MRRKRACLPAAAVFDFSEGIGYYGVCVQQQLLGSSNPVDFSCDFMTWFCFAFPPSGRSGNSSDLRGLSMPTHTQCHFAHRPGADISPVDLPAMPRSLARRLSFSLRTLARRARKEVHMPEYVEHLVLLKAARQPTPDEVARLQALSTLPGVVFLSQGENYTARGQGFNYGIVVRFTSKEAESKYQEHPMHVAVREEVIKPLLDTKQAGPVLAMDYVHTQPPRGLELLGIGLLAGALVGVLAQRARS